MSNKQQKKVTKSGGASTPPAKTQAEKPNQGVTPKKKFTKKSKASKVAKDLSPKLNTQAIKIKGALPQEVEEHKRIPDIQEKEFTVIEDNTVPDGLSPAGPENPLLEEEVKEGVVQSAKQVRWNRKKYPAIKPHKNANYPEVTYHLPVSNSYTPEVVAAIQQFHPIAKISELKVSYSDNEHPFCAAVRSVAEAYALSSLISELSYLPDSGFILDVGGAARRHHSNGRSYVWSCIPTHDSRDVIRQFALPPGGHCNHSWNECKCVPAQGVRLDASISVHSLYYIKPKDLLTNLLKQRHAVHYAVVHMYGEEEGSLMMSEMQYKKGNGSIWVKAKGNLTAYVHDDCEWMTKGHYSSPGLGTLEWDIARRFDDVHVLRFVATKRFTKAPLPMPAQGEADVELKVEEEDPVVVYSKIFNECIDYSAEINAKSMALFQRRVRMKGIEAGCDMKNLVQYTDYRWKTQEAVLMETPVNLGSVASLRQAARTLTVSRWRFWQYPKFWACLMLLLSLLSFLSRSSVITFILKPTPFVWQFATGSVDSFLFLLSTLAICAYYVIAAVSKISMLHRFRRFRCNLLKMRGGTKVNDYCCKLPAREIDPSKCLKLRYPRDYSEECTEKPAAYAMVYHPEHAPYFARKCPHNLVSCLRDKLLYKIPGSGNYNLPLHPILVGIANRMRGVIVPLEWEEWVSRFEPAKQRRLRREMEENSMESIKSWNDSQLFPKFEGYPEPKYPRPIISANVWFNYSTGRWLIPIAEALAELLPAHLCFPLHGDSADIGRFHDDHKHHHKYDSDFSAFDSSQRDGALTMISDFFSLAGMPKRVVERELTDLQAIKLTTRNGLKAKIKSIRCSGRAATLVGNSLVTLNTALHLYGDDLAALLVKGDDCVLYLSKPLSSVTDKVAEHLAQGLVVKLREVNDYDVEFCSSIFLPCSEGTVLVPKPGKLMAKTFWDKHLHHTAEETERHFASIIKGMHTTIAPVPGFNGLLGHPLYKKLFDKVEKHRENYNEYTDVVFTPNEETLLYVCERYGLSGEQLEELSLELQSGFPIRLSTVAAKAMIEKDWGNENDGSHLSENDRVLDITKTLHHVDFYGPWFEEVFRYFLPVPTTLFLGIYETYLSGNPLHLAAHILLYFVGIRSIFLALMLHFSINSAGLYLNCVDMVTKASKRASKKAKKQAPPKMQVRASKGKSNRTKSNGITRLAAMVADPCSSVLEQGLYGTEVGILSRYKNTKATSSVATHGYVLWAPSYAGYDYNGPNFNAYRFTTDDPSTGPVNSALEPLGKTDAAGWAWQVGASAFVQTDLVQEFRTVAACLRAVYTGTTSSCAGRVALLDNIPADLMVRSLPPSVEQMFSYAAETERTGLDPMEIRFRPSSESSNMRATDTPVFTWPADSRAVLSDTAHANAPTLIGFAWTGVPSNSFSFDFIQCIEWKPTPIEGYVEAPVKQVSNTPLWQSAMKYLDDRFPNWQTKVMGGAANAAMSYASRVANVALGGPPQRLRVGYH